MIIVFGSINIDLVTRVERLPQSGETVLGPDYAIHPGGKGANQALAARRAGADVALIGAVGRDDFAETALSLLAADGVDLSRVSRVDAPPARPSSPSTGTAPTRSSSPRARMRRRGRAPSPASAQGRTICCCSSGKCPRRAASRPPRR